MVFHGILGTCSFLNCLCVLVLKMFYFVITLVSVVKGVTKLFLKIVLKGVSVKSFYLSKYLLAPTYSKKDFSILVSFRQRYPTIKEWVAPSLEL